MTYSIGEIEQITGIKPQTLRYWEERIPGFAPQKDIGGWRVYTAKDLELILRLKYLITEKKFTTEGAKQQVLCDLQSFETKSVVLQNISQIRLDLLNIYKQVHKSINQK